MSIKVSTAVKDRLMGMSMSMSSDDEGEAEESLNDQEKYERKLHFLSLTCENIQNENKGLTRRLIEVKKNLRKARRIRMKLLLKLDDLGDPWRSIKSNQNQNQSPSTSSTIIKPSTSTSSTMSILQPPPPPPDYNSSINFMRQQQQQQQTTKLPSNSTIMNNQRSINSNIKQQSVSQQQSQSSFMMANNLSLPPGQIINTPISLPQLQQSSESDFNSIMINSSMMNLQIQMPLSPESNSPFMNDNDVMILN